MISGEVARCLSREDYKKDMAANPTVNAEKNPAPPGSYLFCTIAQKDAALALVDEEKNPAPPGSYLFCTIA
ncbi:hypothetical protein BCR35DRAFT_336276 [Leucosporidium creatinivorum]|uniref:Uncharacterized protein n=2 Tax=Leucosporidium creatinivorum TaxID=106004 RepID=A0A1Y2CEH0_9BASI|nr:hypothetical protein BCR35DRAFT_336276 [Leucosporidium creatinivorum]